MKRLGIVLALLVVASPAMAGGGWSFDGYVAINLLDITLGVLGETSSVNWLDSLRGGGVWHDDNGWRMGFLFDARSIPAAGSLIGFNIDRPKVSYGLLFGYEGMSLGVAHTLEWGVGADGSLHLLVGAGVPVEQATP